jgi:hypothetical protein
MFVMKSEPFLMATHHLSSGANFFTAASRKASKSFRSPMALVRTIVLTIAAAAISTC